MSSSYGENLLLTIFGQSHSAAIGMTLQGIPAGEEIDLAYLQAFLDRRAPGKNAWSTPRREADVPEFLSGLVGNVTCGAPLTAILRMLRTLTVNPAADIRTVIDTPKEQEDIFSACDSLLSSLSHARKNFLQILEELEALKKEQENNPPL